MIWEVTWELKLQNLINWGIWGRFSHNLQVPLHLCRGLATQAIFSPMGICKGRVLSTSGSSVPANLFTSSPRPDDYAHTMTTAEVVRALKRTKLNTTLGPDNICGRTLKYCAKQLGGGFQHVFQSSLTSSTVPAKHSTVIPMPKKGITILNNLRPVATTSLLSEAAPPPSRGSQSRAWRTKCNWWLSATVWYTSDYYTWVPQFIPLNFIEDRGLILSVAVTKDVTSMYYLICSGRFMIIRDWRNDTNLNRQWFTSQSRSQVQACTHLLLTLHSWSWRPNL